MLAKELANPEIPFLKNTDSLESALKLMEEFKVSQLPIVENDTFKGLLSETEILNSTNLNQSVAKAECNVLQFSVNEFEHIYEVLAKISKLQLSLIPITNDEDLYLGTITLPILIEAISNLAAIKDLGGILQLEMIEYEYSLSEISQIVESNGGKILSLYIHTHSDSDKLDVTLKVNKTDLSPIIQTFERYNYKIAAAFHKSEMQQELKHRYNEFIKYLNI